MIAFELELPELHSQTKAKRNKLKVMVRFKGVITVHSDLFCQRRCAVLLGITNENDLNFFFFVQVFVYMNKNEQKYAGKNILTHLHFSHTLQSSKYQGNLW